ncbi:MAG: aspartate aminotransferase family protein [Sandaracinaceae bacterium]|nr:aspartate aminotransferase family protein [Sandaracinaceae bacterium]
MHYHSPSTSVSLMSLPLGNHPPLIHTPPPGPASSALVEILAQSECPALTARRARRKEQSGAPSDPIVWREAVGANVVDADGNIYVDLSSGFGVASLGHRHPSIIAAIRKQSERLIHALGDLHPSDVKIELLKRLGEWSGLTEARVILGSDGSDAIDAAIKTALLATGRPGVLAFEGGYHGLAMGPLSICGYSSAFRAPFKHHLSPHIVFTPHPSPTTPLEKAISSVLQSHEEATKAGISIGALVIEAMIGRGGVREPPPGFLRWLRSFTKSIGAIFIVDEIFTGLHRTGPRLLSMAHGADPDIVCLGKALGGGLPISACIGRGEVMEAWRSAPSGEALHTATFFGNPLACAAALASLDTFESLDIENHVTQLGQMLLQRLLKIAGDFSFIREVRGRGLAIGIEFVNSSICLRTISELLRCGYITIPGGPEGCVMQISPPLLISESLLLSFVECLSSILQTLHNQTTTTKTTHAS